MPSLSSYGSYGGYNEDPLYKKMGGDFNLKDFLSDMASKVQVPK
jgi:hypothetical protein